MDLSFRIFLWVVIAFLSSVLTYLVLLYIDERKKKKEVEKEIEKEVEERGRNRS